MTRRKLCLAGLIIHLSAMSFSQDFQVVFDDAPASPEAKNSELKAEPKLKDTLRFMIVQKAREYIGVKYKYGQANENGFDCSGYVKYIYENFGFTIPRSSYEQYNFTTRLEESTAKPGDLVFFITRGKRISHVGIYLGDNYFIHAPGAGKNVCIDSLDSDYYKRHLAGFGGILTSTL